LCEKGKGKEERGKLKREKRTCGGGYGLNFGGRGFHGKKEIGANQPSSVCDIGEAIKIGTLGPKFQEKAREDTPMKGKGKDRKEKKTFGVGDILPTTIELVAGGDRWGNHEGKL